MRLHHISAFGSSTLCVALLTGCASTPPGLPIVEGPASPDELQRYEAVIQARRDVHCAESGELQVTCESKAGLAWIFTRSGHPAHPAVSASVWVWYQTPQGQNIRVDRAGQFGGDKAAYEVWRNQLVAGDEQQLQTLDELALAK